MFFEQRAYGCLYLYPVKELTKIRDGITFLYRLRKKYAVENEMKITEMNYRKERRGNGNDVTSRTFII